MFIKKKNIHFLLDAYCMILKELASLISNLIALDERSLEKFQKNNEKLQYSNFAEIMNFFFCFLSLPNSYSNKMGHNKTQIDVSNKKRNAIFFPRFYCLNCGKKFSYSQLTYLEKIKGNLICSQCDFLNKAYRTKINKEIYLDQDLKILSKNSCYFLKDKMEKKLLDLKVKEFSSLEALFNDEKLHYFYIINNIYSDLLF